jgi:hypothetical protein
MNEFERLSDIEQEIVNVCTPISLKLGHADSDMLNGFLESIGGLGMVLECFAKEVTEWTCFETCQEHDKLLRELFESIILRIERLDDSLHTNN